MDWNWFFSSVAQSAAAIVGIFGAFIITKVVSNQASFKEKTTRLRALHTDGEKLVDSANHLSFAWYVRLNRKYELEAAGKLLKDNEDLEPDELYSRLKFPRFLPRQDAIGDLQALKYLRERAAEAKRRRREEELRKLREVDRGGGALAHSAFEALGGFGRASAFAEPLNIVDSVAFRPFVALEKQRDAIDALEVDIRHHMRTTTDFLQTTKSNPESSPEITWALGMVAGLFLVGVIYPLSFLPTPPTGAPAVTLHAIWDQVFSLRGLLLITVSGIFLAALTMFAIINYRLRYPRDEVERLVAFTKIGAYSEYYAIAEDNDRLARSQAPAEPLEPDTAKPGSE